MIPATETLNGPEWAHGCENCEYGIVAAPDILTAFPLFESRPVQAHEELILFCDCKAGHLYRQHLRRLYNAIGWETRKNVLEHISALSTPTIHLEPTP